MAIVVVFRNTLSAVQHPYEGAYWREDARCFKNIWTFIAEGGDLSVSQDNLERDYEAVIQTRWDPDGENEWSD